MFDFQKEVVLNSLNDVKDFGATVRVDGMLYKKEYMGDVFKTVAVEGTPAVLTIDVAAAKDVVKNVMQFVIELGLDNDYRGDFGSVLYYFRKPIVVTMNVDSSADDVAKAFKKAGFVDYKLYDIYTAKSENKPKGVNPTGDQIVLVMTDNYITVRKAEVMDWECSETSCNGESVEVPVSRLDLMNGYTKNVVGFGTYEYMIHNLRLPTHANIRFASPAEVEMPIKGGKYTQFSFEYTVPRRLGGLSVAGQKTESTTIHTFFVLESGNNVETFESYLAKPANEDVPTDNTENTEE